MKVIRNKEIEIKGTYNIQYIPVRNNRIPQITITIPVNFNKDNLDLYTYLLLLKIIKDIPRYNSKFRGYELFIDECLS